MCDISRILILNSLLVIDFPKNSASTIRATSDTRRSRQWRRPKKPKTSRELPRDEKNWSGNVEKRARQAGQVNINTKKGTIKRARRMKSPCNCRFMCTRRMPDERREIIYKKFYKTEEQKDKWAYIARWYTTSSPVSGGTRKKQSRTYYLDAGQGRKVKVCKKMFLNTFGICDHVFKTIEEKKKNKEGFAIADKLGKHNNRASKTPVGIFDSVVRHIKSYAAEPSHYCRKDTNKDYLIHQSLNVALMHREYLKNLEETKSPVPRAMISTFRRIFDFHFNINLNRPKKDLCQRCTAYDLLSGEEKLLYKTKQHKHLQNKEDVSKICNDEIGSFAKSKDCFVACFDLLKVLTIPRTETGVQYHKLKIKLFNFIIFDMCKHQGYCLIWNETIAAKGTDEVASCLYKLIKAKKKEGFQTFSFYGDNCGGQNRNSIVFCALLYIANILDVDITLRFLEVGHTQNSGDSMHRNIEQISKFREIFTQTEWADLMRKAAVQHPYEVDEVEQDIVFDFHEMASRLDWKVMKINRAREIHFASGILDTVAVKYDTFDSPIQDVTLPSKYPAEDWTKDPPSIKYTEKLKLDKNKIKHLAEMVKKGDIPQEKVKFIQDIVDENTVDEGVLEDDGEGAVENEEVFRK